MPDLPLDHDDNDELIAGLLDDGDQAAPGSRSIWVFLGALVAVLAMVAVALALHPWAHAGVPRH